VHERYGPSLRNMFRCVNQDISHQDFLLLLYQLVLYQLIIDKISRKVWGIGVCSSIIDT